jgi:ferredoxin, 2Fe-2S
MPKVIFLPFNSIVNGIKGKSLLDLAFENDIVIEHNCGGLCTCTSCRVLIKKGMHLLKTKSEEEKEILSDSGFLENEFRLSCQCIITEDSDEEIIAYISQPSN